MESNQRRRENESFFCHHDPAKSPVRHMSISNCSADIYFFQADKAVPSSSCSHHSHFSWRFHNSCIMDSQSKRYSSYSLFFFFFLIKDLKLKSNRILTRVTQGLFFLCRFAKSKTTYSELSKTKQEMSIWTTSSFIVS